MVLDILESEIGYHDGKEYNYNIVWPKVVNDDDAYIVVHYIVLLMAQDYKPDIILVGSYLFLCAALGNIGNAM